MTAKTQPFDVRNRGGQTAITVYPRSRGGFVFRYYLGGKARTVERVDRKEIISEAQRIAAGIDAGLAQTGNLTAADMESYVHAVGHLGPGSPPLHAIVAEWRAAREVLGGAGSLVEAARLWVDRHGAHLGALKTTPEVLAEMIESKQNGRRRYDPSTFRTMQLSLERFAAAVADRPITSITEKDIDRYLGKL